MELLTKNPDQMTDLEFDQFERLLRIGDQVHDQNVGVRISRTAKVTLCTRNEILVAIAALKNPLDSYRKRIAQKSHNSLDIECYPYELGYVVVDPAFRNQGLSYAVAYACVQEAAKNGLFATTTSNNFQMIRVLKKLDFHQSGCEYRSERDNRNMSVFLRSPIKALSLSLSI